MSEQDNVDSGAHAAQPGVRLGLCVVLGLLGTWLMPSEGGFFPHVSGGHHGPALLTWLAVAAAGVIQHHRSEHIQTPARLFVWMGLALTITLVPIPPAGMHDLFDGLSLAKISAIGLVLLMAGASCFGSRVEGGACRLRARDLMRGLLIAVASPLILFSSRPRRGSPSALLRASFTIFLCALAFPLLSLGRDGCPRFVWNLCNFDNVILICRSFSHWAWLGCAAICLLTPWPEILRLGEPNTGTRVRAKGLLAVVGLGATAGVMLAILKWRIFLAVRAYALVLLYSDWYALALLFMVTPWGRHLRLPKLGELDPKARMSSPATVLFLALALIPLALWCGPAIRTLATGRLFTARFDPSWVGWTLDQSTLHSGFWRFTMLAGMISAHVAVARWLSDRSSPAGYWAFTLPAAGLFLCLLSYLTCVISSLLVYIGTLGITLLRMYGLVYGLGCCILALGFLRWALRRPNMKEKA